MGNTFLGDIPGEQMLHSATPVVALGSDAQQGLGIVPFDCTVVDVKMVPQAAVTGDDTNNFTLSVLNGGSGGTGTTSVASKAYVTGVDSVAKVPETMTNSGTAANLNLDKDDVLVWDKTEAGSGLATVQMEVIITVTAR
jgi:hypothetical protein